MILRITNRAGKRMFQKNYLITDNIRRQIVMNLHPSLNISSKRNVLTNHNAKKLQKWRSEGPKRK
jgi:hypothetical protein